MKVFKIIIGIIVVVIALSIGYLAMLPSSYIVERSITIEAPKDLVMMHLSRFSEWDNWSPWKVKDTNANYTYEGADGAVGSKMSWVTSLPPDDKNQIGVGGMALTELSDSAARFELWFEKPWEMTSKNGFTVSYDNGKTTVKWYDKGELGFLSRPVGKMMDGIIGPDFEKGLINLKNHVEKHFANMASNYSIEEMEIEPFAYYSLIDSVVVEDIGKAMGQSLGKIIAFFGKNQINPTGPPFVIYHTWDGKSTRMESGLPVLEIMDVADNETINSNMSYGGKVIKTIHTGSYEGTGNAHSAIDKYINNNQLEIVGSPWEVYVNDPSIEPDTSKWITEIYYPVR